MNKCLVDRKVTQMEEEGDSHLDRLFQGKIVSPCKIPIRKLVQNIGEGLG